MPLLRWSLLVAVVLVGLSAGPAFSHAERIGSTPQERGRLKAAPSTLTIEFSEPPIGDADFEVLDGCDRDVVEDVEVQDKEITATLAAGEPGTWNVQTQVVSGIDGHATEDRWRFQVAGKADCESPADPPGAAAGGGSGDQSDDEGSPLLAFAAGTLVVIALALLLRGRSSGS